MAYTKVDEKKGAPVSTGTGFGTIVFEAVLITAALLSVATCLVGPPVVWGWLRGNYQKPSEEWKMVSDPEANPRAPPPASKDDVFKSTQVPYPEYKPEPPLVLLPSILVVDWICQPAPRLTTSPSEKTIYQCEAAEVRYGNGTVRLAVDYYNQILFTPEIATQVSCSRPMLRINGSDYHACAFIPLDLQAKMAARGHLCNEEYFKRIQHELCEEYYRARAVYYDEAAHNPAIRFDTYDSEELQRWYFANLFGVYGIENTKTGAGLG